MAVQTLKLCNDDADVRCAPRDGYSGKFFDCRTECGAVCVGAYAADTFDNIKVLDIVFAFAGFFKPSVVIAHSDDGIDDLFPFKGEREGRRFFE
jgi:hypothetical protein